MRTAVFSVVKLLPLAPISTSTSLFSKCAPPAFCCYTPSPTFTNRTRLLCRKAISQEAPATYKQVTMSTSPAPAKCLKTPQFGKIENLKPDIFTIEPPQPHEVRIAVKAIGMNFADIFGVLGLYPMAKTVPFVPGFEVSGVVDAVGSDVTTCKPGDRVYGVTLFGGYTTMINIRHDLVFPIKGDWSFEEAAAWPAQAFTAWYALIALGGISAGVCRPITSPRKLVLVHSAAGGVGLILVSLLKHLGGEPICTIGSPRKVDVLMKRGVPRENIIVRGVDDVDGFEKTVRQKLLSEGEGVDVVIDSVLGAYFKEGWSLLNRGGRYLVMGSASSMPSGSLSLLNPRELISLGWKFMTRPRLDLLSAMGENKTLSPFNVAGLFDQADLLRDGLREMDAFGLEKPVIGRTFKFEQVQEALSYFQSGQSIGKNVIVVDE